MKSALIIQALLFFGLAAAHAAPAVPAEDLLRLGLTPPDAIVRHVNELKLSPEQESKLKELHDTAKSQAASLDAKIEEQRKQLEATVATDNGSITDAETALDALLQSEAEIKRLQLRTILGMNGALNPEQRTQALALAKRDADLQPVIESKIAKLKAAVDALGFEPTQAIKERGQAIEHLLANGETEAANQALDSAIVDLGVEASTGSEPDTVDFTSFAPGDTDPTVLEQRFRAVERNVQQVVRLTTLRQLMQAHDALEVAKQTEDPIAAGQILTWAETILK